MIIDFLFKFILKQQKVNEYLKKKYGASDFTVGKK